MDHSLLTCTATREYRQGREPEIGFVRLQKKPPPKSVPFLKNCKSRRDSSSWQIRELGHRFKRFETPEEASPRRREPSRRAGAEKQASTRAACGAHSRRDGRRGGRREWGSPNV